jgi:hypothetical protein
MTGAATLITSTTVHPAGFSGLAARNNALQSSKSDGRAYGAYKGEIGVALLVAELQAPEHARMALDAEGRPRHDA